MIPVEWSLFDPEETAGFAESGHSTFGISRGRRSSLAYRGLAARSSVARA